MDISAYWIKIKESELSVKKAHRLDQVLSQLIPEYYKGIYIDEFENENGEMNILLIATSGIIQKIQTVLNNGIKHSIKDVTFDIIDNNTELLAELNEISHIIEYFKNNFISYDDILDKISRCGVGCLTEFDKGVLTNFKKIKKYSTQPNFLLSA